MEEYTMIFDGKQVIGDYINNINQRKIKTKDGIEYPFCVLAVDNETVIIKEVSGTIRSIDLEHDIIQDDLVPVYTAFKQYKPKEKTTKKPAKKNQKNKKEKKETDKND